MAMVVQLSTYSALAVLTVEEQFTEFPIEHWTQGKRRSAHGRKPSLNNIFNILVSKQVAGSDAMLGHCL